MIKKLPYILVFIILLLLIIFSLKKNNKYEILLNNIEFNDKKISLLKEVQGEESLLLKENYSKKYIISLNKKTYLKENYVDSFVVNNEKQDYIVIVSSYDDHSDFDAYSIYIFDGEKELNNNQEIIWFGKWFNGDPVLEELIYSEDSKKGIIKELQYTKLHSR